MERGDDYEAINSEKCEAGGEVEECAREAIVKKKAQEDDGN